MPTPGCRYRECPRDERLAGLCILHMPKELPEANDEARAIAKEFEPAWLEELEARIADTSTDTIAIKGVCFPDLSLMQRQFDRPVGFYRITVAGSMTIGGCQFPSGLLISDSDLNALQCFDSWFSVPQTGPLFRRRAPDDVEKRGLELFGVRVRGNASFGDLRIGETAKFDGWFEQRATFSACLFAGYVWFAENCGGDVTFDRSEFGALTEFRAARFNGSLTFIGGEEDMMFHNVVDFRGLRLGVESKVSFTNVNLSRASFLDTRIEDFVFRRVAWYHPRPRLFRWARSRAAIFDEFHRLSLDITYEQIAEVYRQLVLNHEKKRDYTTAEDFNIGEMEMLRRASRSRLNGYAIYRTLSRYGTSYTHAFVVLLLIVALLAGAFLFTGFRADRHVIAYDLAFTAPFASAADVLRDARDALLYTLSIAAFSREHFYDPLGWQTRALTYLAALLIPAQAALVLLAIRRRFKR